MSGPDYGYYAGGNKAGSASATVEKFSLTLFAFSFLHVFKIITINIITKNNIINKVIPNH